MFDLIITEHGDPAAEIAKLEVGIRAKTIVIVSQAADHFVSTVRGLIESSPRGSNGHSRPGSPPASQTGRLVGSINMQPEDGGMRQRGGPHVDYAGYLEGGTRKMDARPFVDPAASAVEAAFYGQIEAMVGGL